MKTVLFIGCGNMGQAMLHAWLAKDNHHFSILTPGVKQLPSKVRQYRSASELGQLTFDLVVLAIKPQAIHEVLGEYRHHIAFNGIVLSIAAGISISTLHDYFPQQAIIRCMPNVAAQIGKSITGIVANTQTSAQDKKWIESLLKLNGEILWLHDEDQLNRLTAITGSGPAYVCYFIESYIKAAQTLGFNRKEAKKMVLHTINGSLHLLLTTDKEPETLRHSVTSPNGTTQAGLNEMMRDRHLEDSLDDTLQAAYNRANELSK